MFDIEKTLADFGLTLEQYETMLKECSDKVHKVSDIDWQEIAEKYNIDFARDTIRKGSQPPLFGGVFVRDFYLWKESLKNNSNEHDYKKETQELIRELERQKIKFRDERTAWAKQNYRDARVEETLDLLESDLRTLGKINFEAHSTPIINGDNEMIICLSDLHIGQTFHSLFGEYNTDIAVKRLNEYLNQIREIADLYKVKKAHVLSLGDQLSGNIHKTIQITNKENVIEQIKQSTEIISSFCYELTKLFEHVHFYNVSGNHSRIDKKEDALHDERLDDLIGWAVSLCLAHIRNFHYMKHRNLDIGICDLSVCGKTYIGCHGDFDPMSKQGVANLSMMLGFIPYGIFKGHLHYPAYNELNGVKVIQSGSLVGCGDQHTVECRLIGKPSQTVCVCDDRGIKAHFPIELS